MQEIWLPSNIPNSKSVGRFGDFTKEFTDKDGQKKATTKLMLYTQVPGVAEQSAQTVLNDASGEKVKSDYSAAWELYLKNKAAPQAAPTPTATEYGVKGTPIEYADFLGKDHTAKLKMMGFLTIEQIAQMSDAQCQNIGFGAMTWRKKAGEFLVVRNDSIAHGVAPVAPPVPEGPSVADLMAQLAEANAKIAALAEMMAKPAVEEAPKPRRGRPPKAAEPQPEA